MTEMCIKCGEELDIEDLGDEDCPKPYWICETKGCNYSRRVKYWSR